MLLTTQGINKKRGELLNIAAYQKMSIIKCYLISANISISCTLLNEGMNNRRTFIKQLGSYGMALPLSFDIADLLLDAKSKPALHTPDWESIRKDFLASNSKTINLNNGSAGIMPRPVLEKYKTYLEAINAFAPYKVLEGWSDEILNAAWDYPLVDYSCQAIAKKYNLHIDTVDQKLHLLDDDQIVELYREKITEKTRLIILTWMTHREGRLLPVKEICTMARNHGIDVLVDGAHCIGQIPVDLEALACDYFASSLHKWLNAPLGSGLLFIRKDKIALQKPPVSYPDKLQSGMKKYTYLGTRAYQNLMTLGDALDYLELTGIDFKRQRLSALTNRWMQTLESNERITIYSRAESSVAVAALGIRGLGGGKIKKLLNEKFDIHVKASSYPGQAMIRISPNIYTNFEEIDRLSEALSYITDNY
jgi:selenocysteine lyase/cysteine desulfurase